MKVTRHERRVVQLIADGEDADGIAEELGLSRWTIRDQVRLLRRKLNAGSLEELPAALARYDERRSAA